MTETGTWLMQELTPKQREVLFFVVRGFKNHEIAALMNVSIDTVKAHLGDIYYRSEISNRKNLISFCKFHGVETPKAQPKPSL